MSTSRKQDNSDRGTFQAFFMCVCLMFLSQSNFFATSEVSTNSTSDLSCKQEAIFISLQYLQEPVDRVLQKI